MSFEKFSKFFKLEDSPDAKFDNGSDLSDTRLDMESYGDLKFNLENAKNFQEIFKIVKKSVKKVLGRERAGLMLVLADLPLHVGAFHGIGSNSIVMNRRLLEAVEERNGTKLEINSYIFMILLHEYLHSLGCVDERVTKRLVYEISIEVFGEGHPATKMAIDGLAKLVNNPSARSLQNGRYPEIVKEFDPSYKSYIH